MMDIKNERYKESELSKIKPVKKDTYNKDIVRKTKPKEKKNNL